jgi:hypothetical protein
MAAPAEASEAAQALIVHQLELVEAGVVTSAASSYVGPRDRRGGGALDQVAFAVLDPGGLNRPEVGDAVRHGLAFRGCPGL